MKILLTNDDGIEAPGINILAEHLLEAGHQIKIVAPENEQSATSHSITLHNPLRITEKAPDRYSVSGSPADCVILAAKVILKEKIDLVISGINGGQNMGEDILYSGTVAAALEAVFMGFPAIALSLASYTDQKFATAACFMKKMLKNNIHELIEQKEVLNINVPNVEIEEVKGIRVSGTGHRRYQDFVKVQKDPRGRKIYWIGGDQPVWSKIDSDFKNVSENYISITPIYPDFNKTESIRKIKNWVNSKQF